MGQTICVGQEENSARAATHKLALSAFHWQRCLYEADPQPFNHTSSAVTLVAFRDFAPRELLLLFTRRS